MVDPKRRELFTSLSSAVAGKAEGPAPIRPPYAPDPALFQTLCVACESKPCVKACEEEIIVIGTDGTPRLDFSRRGCTFCEACADACEPGVLRDKTLNFIDAKVEIDVLKCVAWHQVMCSSCKEPCLEDAIAFLGLFRPEIVADRCTACGFCLAVCPTDAINITQGKAS
ncbi:ferredoxin-type protein NapF [Hydrogenimonas sp.]